MTINREYYEAQLTEFIHLEPTKYVLMTYPQICCMLDFIEWELNKQQERADKDTGHRENAPVQEQCDYLKGDLQSLTREFYERTGLKLNMISLEQNEHINTYWDIELHLKR